MSLPAAAFAKQLQATFPRYYDYIVDRLKELLEKNGSNGTSVVIVQLLDDFPSVIPLPPGQTVFGRSSKCTVQIERETVSRVHFAIDYTPGQTATITDLGSRNGTFVNGIAITAPTPLDPAGCCIHVGFTLVYFLTL